MKTITIFGREMKSKNGQKWVKYTYVNKNGKWYQVKISSKSAMQLDGLTGYIKITFGVDDYFIKDGEVKNGFQNNDTIWVLELEDYVQDLEAEAKAEERKKATAEARASELFGD